MSIYNFPNQRIKESEKNEEWYKSHIINYISYAKTDSYVKKRREMLELYYAYQAKLSPEKDQIICKTLTERYGENLGPKYEVYPLCETIVDQVVSKYRLRPLKRRCFSSNPDAVIKKFDKKIELLTEQLIREANQEVSADLGIDVESPNPDIQVPKDVEEYMSKSYRTMAEEISERLLYQGLVVRKQKEKIYDALTHFLCVGRVFAFPIKRNNQPDIFVPHLLDSFYDINPHSSIQDDLAYFVYDEYLTPNEIFNNFEEIANDEKKKAIIESYANINSTTDQSRFSSNQASDWFRSEGNDHRVRVVYMSWMSKKVIRALKVNNKNTGREEYKLLNDKDKERNRDKHRLVKKEIDVERFIIMCGPDVVVSYGESDFQLSKIAAPDKKYLKPVGVIDKMSLQTNEIRSLVKKIAFLQDFASEILYEIRLALRQIDGNVLGYDLADIPKEWASLGINVINKVNFHLKRDRVKYYNSKQTRGNTYASSNNVSQKGRIDELVNLLIMIEDIARRIAGVTKEELGDAHHNQKATVAQMNLTAGTISSERYYGVFDTFVESLLDRYIMFSKHIYKKGELYSYFGGDNEQKFIQISEDWHNEDIGVHISDNGKEYERSQKIDAIAEQAFVNATGTPEIMRELLRILFAEDSSEKIAIFDSGMKKLEEIKAANERAESEQADKLAEIERMKQDREDLRNDKKLKNNIEVAEIYARSKSDETAEREHGQNLRKAADVELELSKENNKE